MSTMRDRKPSLDRSLSDSRQSSQVTHTGDGDRHNQAINSNKLLQLQMTVGNQAVLQLLQENSGVKRLPTSNKPIQATWLDDKKNESYRWDMLIDGVQWYTNKETGLMRYEIKDEKQVTIGKLKDYQQMEGIEQTQEEWQKSSVSSDILGGLDSSISSEEQLNTNILMTDTLNRFDTSSQFKDMYKLENGKLLSVFKDGSSSGALKEVHYLNRIASHGLKTPNPELIDVVHKGKKTLGITMDIVKGVFVDIAKIDNDSIIGYLLHEAITGKKIDTSEFGLIKLIQKSKLPWDEVDSDLMGNITKEIESILAASETLVINDLQGFVTATGDFVIIDPQWAGNKSGMTQIERPFIINTYKKLELALIDLKAGKSMGYSGQSTVGRPTVKSKNPLDRVKKGW